MHACSVPFAAVPVASVVRTVAPHSHGPIAGLLDADVGGDVEGAGAVGAVVEGAGVAGAGDEDAGFDGAVVVGLGVPFFPLLGSGPLLSGPGSGVALTLAC